MIGFFVVRIGDCAFNRKGIDITSGRAQKFKLPQRIAFVVVLNTFAKIKTVGGIGR